MNTALFIGRKSTKKRPNDRLLKNKLKKKHNFLEKRFDYLCFFVTLQTNYALAHIKAKKSQI